jgi:acyl-CoA synthetase (AMP-forming)/AMP-acid ligase II/3-hydroxymyristoyl/3-hydroxydecanoyl-(acyl carrier protein) dehydratase
MHDFVYLADLLVRGRADQHATAFRGATRIDFCTFVQDVAAWQAGFAAQSGTRFALYFHDSYTFATAIFGAWHANKTVYLPGDVLPASLGGLRPLVDGFAGDIPGEPCVSPIPVPELPAWQAIDPQAHALVVYTSGSSGTPVAIEKRLSQLFDEVRSLAQCFGDRIADARICATVSHQHIYGLLFGVLLPLASGRPLMAQRLAFAEDIAAQLGSAGAHVLIASPAHLKRLPEHLDWAPARQSLRAVFSSGGPLPEDALPVCLQLLGQTPIEVYGSSETGGVAWRVRKPGAAAVWQTLPGVATRIEDETLYVRSPHTDSDGWQAMSDRVHAVANGFELLGRSDRIVKIEEKRVSLNAVEQALLSCGLVQDVRIVVQTVRRTHLSVVAVPNDAGWQLVDSSGKNQLTARLRAVLANVVEHSVLPRRWRYVSSLPVNAQGKTTEAALAALFDPRRPDMRVRSRTPDAATVRIDIAANSPYFNGHFPQAPILPGVAQLDWVVLFGRELFDLPPQFLRMEAVKFQQVILPGASIDMALAFEQDLGRLRFALTSERGAHASGRIVFGPAA